MKYEELSGEVIRIFYKVYNKLGYGFLEKVYENAMMVEFKKKDIVCKKQYPINVVYDNEVVGNYIADFLIEDKIIVEIKAIKGLSESDDCQLINYLTATDKEVGLLLNYGAKPEVKRKVFDNSLKKYKSVAKPCHP